MKVHRLSLTAVVVAMAFVTQVPCRPGWAWQTNANGAVSLNDEARVLTADANGDLVGGGFIQNVGGGADFAVVKVSGATGAELWRRVIPGTAALPSGEVRAVALTAAGDVVAAGRINNAATLRDVIVVKLSGATGTELWRRVIDGTASLNDQARSVRIDAVGDVVVGGELQNTGTGLDFTVVKLAGATGVELWRTVLDGTAHGADSAHGVRLDGAGNVVAGGTLQNTGTGADFVVVKLAGATGAELWRHQIDGTASLSDLARTLRVDGAGNVVAAGELQNVGTGLDFTVVKLAGGTGAELWHYVLNGTAGGTDSAHAVRVDALGDVVAAGELQNVGTGMDFTVVKLSGTTGAELWRRQIDGTASVDDIVRTVRVDAGGDVLAGGELWNTGTGLDFAVVKLAGATGLELWRRTINGTASGTDRAHALTDDSAGDVAAAGFTTNIGTGADFTVVKLRGTDGTDFVAPTTTTTTLPLTTTTTTTTTTHPASTTTTLPGATTTTSTSTLPASTTTTTTSATLPGATTTTSTSTLPASTTTTTTSTTLPATTSTTTLLSSTTTTTGATTSTFTSTLPASTTTTTTVLPSTTTTQPGTTTTTSTLPASTTTTMTASTSTTTTLPSSTTTTTHPDASTTTSTLSTSTTSTLSASTTTTTTSTLSTTSTRPATTSTLPHVECDVVPTLVSIACRFDALTASVQTLFPGGSLRDALTTQSMQGSAWIHQAEQAPAQVGTRGIGRALVKAQSALQRFVRHLVSRRAHRVADGDLRPALRTAIHLRTDIKKLRKSL